MHQRPASNLKLDLKPDLKPECRTYLVLVVRRNLFNDKTQNGDTQRNPPPPGFLLSLLSSPSQFLSFSFFLSPFLFVSFSFLYGSVVGGTDGSGVGVPKNLAVGFAEMVGVMDGGTDG